MNSLFCTSLGAKDKNYLNKKHPASFVTVTSITSNQALELKRSVFGDHDFDKFTYKWAKKTDKKLAIKYLNSTLRSASVIVHKEYMLILKMVNVIVGPSLKAQGQDITKDYGNVALANLIFSGRSIIFNHQLFNELLKHFENILTDSSDKNFDSFFSYAARQKTNSEFDRIFKLLTKSSALDRNILRLAAQEEKNSIAHTSVFKLTNSYKENGAANINFHIMESDELSGLIPLWINENPSAPWLGPKGKLTLCNECSPQFELTSFITDALADCFNISEKMTDEDYRTELFNTAVKKLLLSAIWPTTAVVADDFKKAQNKITEQDNQK